MATKKNLPKIVINYFKRSVYETDGYLASPKNSKWHWTHCRELFHSQEKENKKTTNRLLYHSKDIGAAISFIRMAEKILGLSKKNASKIYRTNDKKIIYITYGSWWSKTARRDLFTIFLRIGRFYKVRGLTEEQKIKRWWDIAIGNKYLRQTKIALNRFMKGKALFNENLRVKTSVSIYNEYNEYSGVKYIYAPIIWRGWVNTFGNLTTKEVEKRLI